MKKVIVSIVLVCGLGLESSFVIAQIEPEAEALVLIERLSLRESDEPIRNNPKWQKPRKIGVQIPSYPFSPPNRMERLQQAVGDEVEIVPISGPDDPLVSELEAIVNYCSQQMLDNAKNLVWLHNFGVGVDRCGLMPTIGDYDFVLTNAQKTSGPTIAEHVIGLMMTLTRSLNYHYLNQISVSRDASMPVNSQMFDIEGKTMLVAGLGGIGTEVAKRANGLGMRVVATRNSSRSGPDYVDYVGLADELYELASEADVIVNTLPLTTATTALFDEAFFNAVKPGAYFITVGRGPSTVLDDLVAALKDGRIAAAGLDVTSPERLPDDHELLQMNNVVITPHISSLTPEARARMATLMIENVRRYVAGEKLLNEVNLQNGY